jgi:hypothetical protein
MPDVGFKLEATARRFDLDVVRLIAVPEAVPQN